jgi:epsilon-lactone hydrolase
MSREQRLVLDAKLRKAPQTFGPVPVERLREGFAAFMATFPIPAGVRRTPTELAGRPALLVEPEGDAQPGTILYFHGGGNVSGSPETALPLTANLVARTGFRAFSLDYRLAPEHPFPAGADDALNAYRALLDSGEDPSAIAFAGDSRGGGHAVTACLAARDAGLPVPAAIVAFSPGLDYTGTGKSMDTKAGIDPLFTRESLLHTATMYLAGQNPNQPLLSPAVHADLTGFPPILLQVGTNELLLDDSVRLAERARCGRRRDPRHHSRGAARIPGLRRNARRGRPGTRPSSPVPHPAPGGQADGLGDRAGPGGGCRWSRRCRRHDPAELRIIATPGIERFDYFRHVARRREGSEPPEVLLGLQDRFDTHFLHSSTWQRVRPAA